MYVMHGRHGIVEILEIHEIVEILEMPGSAKRTVNVVIRNIRNIKSVEIGQTVPIVPSDRHCGVPEKETVVAADLGPEMPVLIAIPTALTALKYR